MYNPSLSDSYGDSASSHDVDNRYPSTGYSLFRGKVKINKHTFHKEAAEQLGRQKTDCETFNVLCLTALRERITTRQKLHNLFGDAIPRDADKADRSDEKWALPDPAKTREILKYFLSLEIPFDNQPSDNRRSWQHAQYDRPEAAPKLPNLPRTAMGRQPR